MDKVKRFGRRVLSPEANKAEDGRDQWRSRTAFVLASMGGAVGLGNLLRYPSQVYNNVGLQWFIPYLMALILLGIPVLMLEIAIGQAYRGGCLIAYDHINKRTKGVGLGIVFNGFAVVVYYVPILAWVMNYFRNSFSSSIPWQGRGTEFYMVDVVANPDPIPGTFGADGNVISYTSYSAVGMVGETVGWTAFTWFIVWLCLYKGVAVTGRAVYVTMTLPVITMLILLGRSVSLPNAIEGVRLYMGTWFGEKLAGGQIWQSACGQVFFSIGIGMGYFTSYASYNSQMSNAVQDAVIIAVCNSLYEIIGAFAVFGIVGFLELWPEQGIQLGSFTVAFLTYPEALAEMPGAQFWAFLFFFTLMLLGFSSAFALLDTVITMVCDTDWGRKIPRVIVASTAVIISFLLSLIYCTEFGFYLLDSVDTWINNLALIFIVWCECVATTSIYRFKDVIGQIGIPAFALYNLAYLGGQVFGIAVGHAVSPAAGAGMGFGLYVVCAILAILLAKTPDSAGPRFWGRNNTLTKFWWMAFYSGNQLCRDLNVTVAVGKNWAIPWFWGVLLRYISAPILAMVFSFAYPAFYLRRNNPLDIFAFTVAHMGMVLVALGFIVPRMFDVFIPLHRRGEGDLAYAPNVTLGTEDLYVARSMEGTKARMSESRTVVASGADSETEKPLDNDLNQGQGGEVVR